MPERTEKKKRCILDACTIRFLCNTELGGKKLIDYVIDHFTVLIPKHILNVELKHMLVSQNLSRDEAGEIKKYMYSKRGWYEPIDEADFSTCSRCFLKFKESLKVKVNEGEMQGLSLAIYDSVYNQKRNVLLTDDFDARNTILDEFSMLHHSFFVMSSPDIIILMYRLVDSIRREQAFASLNGFWKSMERMTLQTRKRKTSYENYLKNFCRKGLWQEI